MNVLTKNNTIGYNTIVDDAEDKEAVEDHHDEEDTTTISKKNRRQMFLVIGGSVSVLVVLVLFFWATPASPSLPSSMSSASSLSSLRTAAECRPNGDPCIGGYPALPNGGCCDTTTCISKNSDDTCELFTDTSCFCQDNPTPPPTTSPTSVPPGYDPKRDFCYWNKDNVGNYCWNSFYELPYPAYQWEVFRNHIQPNNCGTTCTCGPECTELHQFDPKQDHDCSEPFEEGMDVS